jgi:hypothetical protein
MTFPLQYAVLTNQKPKTEGSYKKTYTRPKLKNLKNSQRSMYKIHTVPMIVVGQIHKCMYTTYVVLKKRLIKEQQEHVQRSCLFNHCSREGWRCGGFTNKHTNQEFNVVGRVHDSVSSSFVLLKIRVILCFCLFLPPHR